MSKHKPAPVLQLRSVLVMIIVLLLPVSASAYLDPTTGSMVISAIVGLFASLVLAVKTYWYRIKAFFKTRPVQTGNSKDADIDSDAGDGAT